MHEHLLGTLHLSLAVVALAAGCLVALLRKGTQRHRNLGRIYVVALLGVNGTALAIYELSDGFGPFHVAAMVSLVTVVAGMLPMWRRRRPPGWLPRHAFWMAGSYVGLLAAAASETATRYLHWNLGAVVVFTSGLIIVIGLAVMFRYIPRIIDQLQGR